MINIKNLTLDFPISDKSIDKSFHRAINNLSIKIKDNHNVAIIGGNGSGKSTLLRVLGGVYSPTSGSVELNGKTTNIFDLSIGIEKDETGLNNIIIRGLYYGISENFIINNIKKIIDFSQLGDFINLPVRTYSSGMRARLAFSILLLLKNEIYLVDEVIGVGDRLFSDKARDLILYRSHSCKNFILASHADGVLRKFCNKGLWLDNGILKMYDDLELVLNEYNNNK